MEKIRMFFCKLADALGAMLTAFVSPNEAEGFIGEHKDEHEEYW